MRNVSLYPYRMASASARALANELGIKRVREDSATFNPRGRTVIDWGNPRMPEWLWSDTSGCMNYPRAVEELSNKLLFFKGLVEWGLQDCIPEFTTNAAVAEDWGCPVIARTHLNGSGGLGAYYWSPDRDVPVPDEMVGAKVQLYTKYIKKESEYRVHFGPLGIFHVQQKRKRFEEPADFKIRSHDKGWVFTINDVHPPASVMDVCNRVIPGLPLDFGALDVVYNAHYDQAKVLEVNTAPGLEGTTLRKYADMFREVLR